MKKQEKFTPEPDKIFHALPLHHSRDLDDGFVHVFGM